MSMKRAVVVGDLDTTEEEEEAAISFFFTICVLDFKLSSNGYQLETLKQTKVEM